MTMMLGLLITPNTTYIFLQFDAQSVFWPRGEDVEEEAIYVDC
jgi:hypothetical protein